MSTSAEAIVDGVAPSTNIGVDLFQSNYNNDLQSSDMTPHSDTGSVSDDEEEAAAAAAAGGWLGAIGSDFKNLATCFKDNTLPVIGGVASFVHSTALSVAAEIAQLEKEGELEAERLSEEYNGNGDGVEERQSRNFSMDASSDARLPLPWEIKQSPGVGGEVVYAPDVELMEAILALSLQEDTFRQPLLTSRGESSHGLDKKGNNYSTTTNFILDESRVNLIRRLLDIDENLAAMHARLSGRSTVRETAFWKNYFSHCDNAVEEILQQRRDVQNNNHSTNTGTSSINISNGNTTVSSKNKNKKIPKRGGGGVAGTSTSTALKICDTTKINILPFQPLQTVDVKPQTAIDANSSFLSEEGEEDNDVNDDDDSGMKKRNDNNTVYNDAVAAADDSSLVPASITDDSSYVNIIPSAPNSLNTFATTRSLDDMVIVGSK